MAKRPKYRPRGMSEGDYQADLLMRRCVRGALARHFGERCKAPGGNWLYIEQPIACGCGAKTLLEVHVPRYEAVSIVYCLACHHVVTINRDHNNRGAVGRALWPAA